MKLLLAAAEGEDYFDLVEALASDDLQVVRTPTPDDFAREIVDAEIVYGFIPTPLFKTARSLKWVQSPGAGVDWITRVEGLVESDVTVTNTRGAHAPSIAEHVFALLLTMTRNMPRSIKWQSEKFWGRAEGYRSSSEIKDSTMGIIGYGQIGRAIAKRATAFEMNVLAIDAYPPAGGAPYVNEVWGTDRLHDLLAASDVIVTSVPYTPESHHLIDADAFAAMRGGSYLVAISRGGIIDEAALVAALQSGKLAGAGIDVAEHEPLPPEDPLWDAPNLLITPHIAGASGPKERRCVEIFRDNVVRYVNGEPLNNIVDKIKGF
jgi:phosphoglycerate dehydrogenase-like enzyme